MSLADVADAPLLLKNALKNTKLDYDYVIMDCAPSLSMLTVNALVATDGVIIPMQCEYFALEGIADLIDTIEKLTQINPKLHIRAWCGRCMTGEVHLPKTCRRSLKIILAKNCTKRSFQEVSDWQKPQVLANLFLSTKNRPRGLLLIISS